MFAICNTCDRHPSVALFIGAGLLAIWACAEGKKIVTAVSGQRGIAVSWHHGGFAVVPSYPLVYLVVPHETASRTRTTALWLILILASFHDVVVGPRMTPDDQLSDRPS